jgi:hypothetical protein
MRKYCDHNTQIPNLKNGCTVITKIQKEHEQTFKSKHVKGIQRAYKNKNYI